MWAIDHDCSICYNELSYFIFYTNSNEKLTEFEHKFMIRVLMIA